LEIVYGKKSDVQPIQTTELFPGAKVVQEQEDSVVLIARKHLLGNSPLPIISIASLGLNDG
jgi:hypothetical protein